MDSKHLDNKDKIIGIWYALGSYLLWGFLPLYWRALIEVPSAEILAHRIIWSFVFVTVILLFNKRWSKLKEVFQSRKRIFGLVISSLLISFNWYIYIWAVNSGQVIEASLGYYINPLISVLLGIFILKERLNFWQLISLMLASVGVIYMTVMYGSVPWIALSLAVSFGLYGLSKKLVNVDSLIGLGLETLMVTPIALIYVIYLQQAKFSSFSLTNPITSLLLIGAGIATATPLLWFAQGAKRIPLSTIGFLQYLAPSISLLLGVFVFGEHFSKTHIVSFSFIWTALLIYSLSKTSLLLQLQPKLSREVKATGK